MFNQQQLQEHSLENYYFYNDDPNALYDVFELFNYYNPVFFGGILQRCSLRWTNKMTRCAGTCTYEGFGSSIIALSQPLLKFRTANEVKETLLHQMIHAYLFIIDPEACKADEGHGPKFKEIMHKINKVTKLSISVYHSFHDQINHHQKHVWRCDGVCRQHPPFYGYVKRSMNRKPQPADRWFKSHQRSCGGNFIKIQGGPEKEKKEKKMSKESKSIQKFNKTSKQKGNTIFQEVKKKKQTKKWGSGGKTIEQYLKEMAEQQLNQKYQNKSID